MAKRSSKPDTKAQKAAQELSDDQQNAGTVAQTGAGETPAPANDTPEVTKEPAKTGADANAAPVETKVAEGKADPEAVTAAVTKGVPLDLAPIPPLSMSAEQSAELSRQIKGDDEPSGDEDPMDQLGPKNLQVTVVGPAKGFRRAGHRFGPEATTLGAETISRRSCDVPVR